MPCGCHAPAEPASWYRPGGRYPTRSRPILTGPPILGMAVVTALRRCAKKERENDLLCRANHRHELRPLAVVGHRDELLAMSAPTREAGHTKKRPADLAERLVAIAADWNLTAATGTWAWARFG